jgi:prevent-host-death family protein
MSVKVSLHQLQDRLAELLNDTVQTGQECVVQRNGKDYAVIVSAQAWHRRQVGRHLDALGPTHKLSRTKQARAEQLLAARNERRLTSRERRELGVLLRECDGILLRRGKALDRIT